MKSTVLRFSFVVVVVLLLLSTFAFAKGKPTRTYSWSVEIVGGNLQPVDGSTYTVRTTRGSGYSEFGFEALAPDSKVQFTEMSNFACEGVYNCDAIFDAIGNGGTIEQPDGVTYHRVEFRVHLGGLDFENMEPGETQIREIPGNDWVDFFIDESNPSEARNYIWGDIQGSITITRTDAQDAVTWSIQCYGSSVDLKELATEILTLCKPNGRGCKEVVSYPSEVAIGTAEPMEFELIFTRSVR